MLKGVDVSVFQGHIDWKKVSSAGIDFAMIKATQGQSIKYKSLYLFTDSQFKNNIINAHNAGIKCGVYHYLTAQNLSETLKEADYFISVIEPYKKYIDLYAAIDAEESRFLPDDKSKLTEIVNVFYDRLKGAGLKPIVYTNPDYINYRLNDISNLDLWLALWRDKSKVPAGYKNMKIWQYYNKGRVPGIGKNIDVDLNLEFFEAADEKPDVNHADYVCKKCGFEQQTRDFLDCYKYSADLWRKLYQNMR